MRVGRHAPLLLVLAFLAQQSTAVAREPDRSSQARLVAEMISYVPSRAFLVEGGAIAIKGGVMMDPEIPVVPIGKLRYPIRYFLDLTNDTKAPVWVDFEWQVNPKKPEVVKSKQVPPGKGYVFFWKAFGVTWDEPVPFKMTVYSDAGRTKTIGLEQASLFFDAKEKDAFLEMFTSSVLTSPPVLTGWREMNGPIARVAGTVADATLQRAVEFMLWKEESKSHRDCEHPVVRVERFDTAAAITLNEPSPETRKVIDAQGESALRSERWWIKSCDQTSSYVVLMIPWPPRGTHFLTHKMPDEPAR